MARSGIGLDERSELLYRRLLRRTNWQTQELAQVMKWPASEVAGAMDTLRAEGLAAVSADDPTAFRAVEPCIALPALLARSMHEGRSPQPRPVEIDRFIALHERAVERIEESADGDGYRHDACTVIERMVAKAESDVVFLVPRHLEGDFAFSRPIVDMALRRGTRLRAVWAPAVFHAHPAMAHAQWLAQQDVQPRMADSVPVYAMIMDGAAAVVVDEAREPRVVRSPAELDSLCAMAERLWERGSAVRQLRRTRATATTRRPRTEIVLRLLAEGLTDDAIARRLGCSVRTVRNDVAAAMVALDARSRFQAGARAMQVGLI
ncbi:LuxR C-terminal-related transcriptional regulator [Streptomyces marokkonensis]|uniref:LuxR C-terminal-related transcriptional regulator n=1 Tax=Streptomyces marokkonensis TaxID=324855 RepID=A0ABW6QA39_9ACTN|nr:LuxR family transcriptional regulator [Streptomyces marokkonensis]